MLLLPSTYKQLGMEVVRVYKDFGTTVVRHKDSGCEPHYP